MTVAGIVADTLLAALTIAVVVDATITSKWLRTSRKELEYIARVAAEARGLEEAFKRGRSK
jgi:hypothetical protein